MSATGGLDHVVFGRDPGIGLARCGAVAIKLQTFDHGVGRRGGVIGFEFVMGVHGMLHRLDRDRRGLHGDEKADKRAGQAARAFCEGLDGQARLFCLAMQRRLCRRRKIVGRRHCLTGPFVGRSPSRRPRRGPADGTAASYARDDIETLGSPASTGQMILRHEAADILWARVAPGYAPEVHQDRE